MYLLRGERVKRHEGVENQFTFRGKQKWPLYCPQGSGTLRQQILMMHGIAWYCMVLHGIA